MDDKTLTIKEAENGYVAELSWCENKKKMDGPTYHHESYILNDLPPEIKKMFSGEFGKSKAPEDKMSEDFSKAEDDANKEE